MCSSDESHLDEAPNVIVVRGPHSKYLSCLIVGSFPKKTLFDGWYWFSLDIDSCSFSWHTHLEGIAWQT
jgi:hypothetical protein